MKGTVKFYNKAKGFGFIKGEDGEEYFVHKTQLPKELILQDGDSVEFTEHHTDKGKQAMQVELDPHK